jgi:hypothetical protein
MKKQENARKLEIKGKEYRYFGLMKNKRYK